MNDAVTEIGYDRPLRRDFASFARRCFRELHPRTPFSFGPHIEIIAAKLTAVIDGETRRLIINLSPRHLTSLLASVAFPAWCLGRNPSGQILCIGYAQEIADKLLRDCRRIVASDWYRRVFATRLAPRHQAVSEFETTAQGSRIVNSIGGVQTGRGADIIIIDDPLKPEEALSDTRRQGANEWFDHTLYSRLNERRRTGTSSVCRRSPRRMRGCRRHRVGGASLRPAARRGIAPGARAIADAGADPPHHWRLEFRRPVPADPGPIGRRARQGGLVQALCAGEDTGL